ncbi:MAG: alpha/beta hydrolase [Chloroflexi bacterium]|nr:alpha/beta hydrolase [Chloroflexota bacterium]
MTAEYPRRGFVHGPDGNIEYMEEGSGPALVLLHPAPSSCTTFQDALPLLADGYRVIAMSQPGFGESDAPPRAYTEVSQYARAVTWLLDGLGLERAHVLGSLTGSLTALETAAGWPERVDRLVVEECFNWNRPGRIEVLEREHGVDESPDGSHLLAMWERARSVTLREASEPAEVARLARRRLLSALSSARPGPDGVTGQDASTLALSRYPLWERAPLVKAPTLVAHGTSSALAGAHERLVGAIPNARGIRPPSTHQFNWRVAPELWARELRSFLAEDAPR